MSAFFRPLLEAHLRTLTIPRYRWWKVKIKATQESESPVGLVPAAYVEQVC